MLHTGSLQHSWRGLGRRSSGRRGRHWAKQVLQILPRTDIHDLKIQTSECPTVLDVVSCPQELLQVLKWRKQPNEIQSRLSSVWLSSSNRLDPLFPSFAAKLVNLCLHRRYSQPSGHLHLQPRSRSFRAIPQAELCHRRNGSRSIGFIPARHCSDPSPTSP